MIEVGGGSPGRSGVGAFAAAVRRCTTPIVVVARRGVARYIGEPARSQLAETFSAHSALIAMALAGDPGAVGQSRLSGVEELSQPLWPAAVALDRVRCSLALQHLKDPCDDPWLEVVDRLSLHGGVVAWRGIAMPRDIAAVAWPPAGTLPALDSSLPSHPDANGYPSAATSDGDPRWRSLWARESGQPPEVRVGGQRPSAAWRRLGDLLVDPPLEGVALRCRPGPGGSQVFHTGSGPTDAVLGWLRVHGLPGDVALLLCEDEQGREHLESATAIPAESRVVRVLGWARAERELVQEPPPLMRPAIVSVQTGDTSGQVGLSLLHRPGTRPVFLAPGARGLSFVRPPGISPVGYVYSVPGPGRAPVEVDGVIGGYAWRPELRGAPAPLGAPARTYEPVDSSLVARTRRRIGKEVRSRRALPRRILLVLPWVTVGGADIFITDLCRELSARDLEIHVLLTYAGTESPLDRRGSLSRHVAGITCAPESFPGRPLPEVIVDIGRRERIGQMIICGGWQAYEGLPGVRAALPGVRVIDILFNDFGHLTNNRRLAPWIDVTVCAYGGLRDLLVNGYGESPDRARTIHIGIDPDRFVPASADGRAKLKTEMGLDPERPLWGYAGRLSDEKCIPDLIRALEMLGGSLRAQIVIQGEGPARDTITSALAGSRHDVLVRPFQDDQVPTLQALDAYVLPSKVEGIPLALMEAAACGALPIATAVGGVPDLVIPGVTGFLAAPEQPGSLAAAMLAAMRTPGDQWAEMAFRARQRVRRTMAWRQTVEAYCALLDEAQATEVIRA